MNIRPARRRGIGKPLLALVILAVVVIASLGVYYETMSRVAIGRTTSTGIVQTNTSKTTSEATTSQLSTGGHNQTQRCNTYDASVSDPGAPHGLFVLFPFPTSPDYAAIQQYVMNSPLVCGANFYVSWAAVDFGPSNATQYNFSQIDGYISTWASAGKIVNLDLWGVGYALGVQRYTPQYVLNQINTVTCSGVSNQTLPIYWEHGYMYNYEAFLKAAYNHFGSEPDVGYIRFGIGVGGEDNPASDIGSAQCLQQFQTYGYSAAKWINYTESIIDFVGSFRSPKQVMVSMNLIPANSQNTTFADAIAATAVPLGIGIGSQGLQSSDLSNYGKGIACSGDWCANFVKYKGTVPLELQTLAASCPDGSCQTGSLTQLITFALQLHAQIFEIYWEDWLVALDPQYQGYTTTYTSALTSAANVVGY